MAPMFVLLSVTCSLWLVWRLMATTAKKRSWSTPRRVSTCLVAGGYAAFAVFCVSGGLFLPDPTNAGHLVATFGALLLVLLGGVIWRIHANTPKPVFPSSTGVNAASKESSHLHAEAISQQLTDAAALPSQPEKTAAVDIVQSDVDAYTSLPSTIPGHLFQAFTNPVKSRKSNASEPKKIANSAVLPNTFQFTYTDHHGDRSQRIVRVMSVSSNGRHRYLEGFCTDRQAIRTFRIDRIDGDLVDQETGELIPVKRLLRNSTVRTSMPFKPTLTAKNSVPQPARIWQTAVLFTGFTSKRREELEDMAIAIGWDVRTTVGSTLDVLVTGPKAGPSKVLKAEALGIEVIDEFEFETRSESAKA